MKYDIRCLSATIRRNTAAPRGPVNMVHMSDCKCVLEKMVHVVTYNPLGRPTHCPCGLPQHKGECRDAARDARGLPPIRWTP